VGPSLALSNLGTDSPAAMIPTGRVKRQRPVMAVGKSPCLVALFPAKLRPIRRPPSPVANS
jgi:hypothetical protein